MSFAAIQIVLEDDLVDTCKPGSRISVVGVYKAIAPRASGTIGGTFKAIVVANSVRQLSREADRELTADDIRYMLLERSWPSRSLMCIPNLSERYRIHTSHTSLKLKHWHTLYTCTELASI